MKQKIIKDGTLFRLLNPDKLTTDAYRKRDKRIAKEAIREEFGTVSRLCRQYALPRANIQEFLDDRTKVLSPKYIPQFREALTTGLLPADWREVREQFKEAVDARAGGIGYEGVATMLKLETWQIPNLLRPEYKATESEAFSALYNFAKGYLSTAENEN